MGIPLNELTEEQKLEDFEVMFNTIEESYPFLDVNKRKYGVNWVTNKDEYIRSVKRIKDLEATLNMILSNLNNAHTHMMGKSFIEYNSNYYKRMDKTILKSLQI